MRKKGSLLESLSGLVGQTGVGPSIDYPQAGEKVQVGHYTIRISGWQGECQVAIDDGDWQTCRSADGYCWYDWAPQNPGRHKIAVRARSGNKWLKTQRACDVK